MALILIIDDDPVIQKLFSQFLAGKGYQTAQAANGKEGLRLMEERTPDLVITDILMPEMDGLEILMAIRSQRGDIPVIAISGGMRTAPINFLQHAKVFGARHVFEKPVPLDVLLKAVEELLQEQP
ncbi:response regulator [Pontiella sulfatireligans]|uniref:Sporulation initiation phosphotransferase F n=1 Tax=Pontiella sulfatireligans TaxID=2750658 RepID=A0A6C2USU9_9BACT|nr:response regulator [Pontiella sulfatireligans]VGO22297.1 Sporulation initiation phosphotransferase F [Pontiella sulfatireligans]